ncbi:hypothetical protein MSPP1_003632 [Malassezia sp. CBS 17886]|nr:hypothetical protein MSPP1_003632 [Malassezia sp. CBS 17886]
MAAPENFAFRLTTPRAVASEVLRGLVHTVCFLRLLGTLEPGTSEVLHVELPHINDTDTEERIRAASEHILERTDAAVGNAGTALVEVLVSWHRPQDTSSRTPPAGMPARAPSPPEARGTPPSRPVFPSPYSWLATTLGGGIGSREHRAQDTSGKEEHHGRASTRVPRALLQDPVSNSEHADPFERWALQLHIHYLQDGAEGAARQLSDFLCTTLLESSSA